MNSVAVFVSNQYLDTGRLRVWAKTVAVGSFVLLTDEPTDANAALSRTLKCSDVVHAIVRMPGTLRRPEDVHKARRQRDQAMIAVADRIVVFGELEQWLALLVNKPVDHFPERV